ARRQAAEALGNLGPHAVAAVPALVNALRDEDVSVHSGALFSLARIGKPAIPPLLEALNSENSQVRKGAAEALCEMGEGGETAVLPPKELLKDGSPDVRVEAATALYRAGYRPMAMIALLTEVAKSDDSGRLGAIRPLGRIGSEAR